jgi:hypothetical protein
VNPPYWVDSNVLIESANGPYTFNRAPTFWSALDDQLNAGLICTSEMVYRELVPFGDELSRWVKNRKQNGLYIDAGDAVQTSLTVVADYVSTCGRYDIANTNEFLSGADPWMIAHLRVSGGTLVTNETALRPLAKKVRIPDVCEPFGIRCITGFEMLDELGIVL